MPKSQQFQKLPAPWDRIFSLGTRTFVWGLLITIIYILRPFFLLIFLTFVFAYVQDHSVDGLQHRIKSRIVRVVLVFLILLSAIVGTGYFVGPRLENQVDDLMTNSPRYLKEADNGIHDFAKDKPWLQELLQQDGKEAKTDEPGGNGNKAKIGSISSEFEHFNDWKRLAEEEPGVVDMETLLKGVCVRRQSFLDRRAPDLREALAHLVGHSMRRICGVASADVR